MLSDVTVAATSLLPLGNGVAPFLRHDVDKAAVLRELAERYGVHAQQRARRARVLRLECLECLECHGCEAEAEGVGAEQQRESRRPTKAAKAAKAMLPPQRSAACVLGHGTIWLLYLTRSNGPLNGGVCFMISRRAMPGEFYPRVAFVHLRFDAPAFDGTVLEGELSRGPDGAWSFAICDVLVDRGRALEARAPLPTRLAKAAHLVRHRHHPRDTDLFVVRRKRWMGAAEMASVVATSTRRDLAGWRALLWVPLQPSAAAVNRRKGGGGGGGAIALLVVLPRRRGPSAAAAAPGMGGGAAEVDDEDDGEDEDGEDDEEDEDVAAPPRTREFWVRGTPLPDVYELHLDRLGALRSVGDGEGGVVDDSGLPMTAGVPSLSASQALAAAIRASSDAAARVTLTFSSRFRKWIPM